MLRHFATIEFIKSQSGRRRKESPMTPGRALAPINDRRLPQCGKIIRLAGRLFNLSISKSIWDRDS
jgi:hypothetical protein